MDLTRFRELDSLSWTVPPAPGESRHEVKLYGSRELLQTMDDKVLEQITNVARLPGLVGAAMTMPDAHWGYGFPIGGVAAFDAERGGIISAGGVGFDISCGIRCLRTDRPLAPSDTIARSAGDSAAAAIITIIATGLRGLFPRGPVPVGGAGAVP